LGLGIIGRVLVSSPIKGGWLWDVLREDRELADVVTSICPTWLWDVGIAFYLFFKMLLLYHISGTSASKNSPLKKYFILCILLLA